MVHLTYSEQIRASKYFRHAKVNELKTIANIEANSFPADEMATEEKIIMRQEIAGNFFRVLVDTNDDIIGYINGTCTTHNYVTHDTMSNHNPLGKTLVLHSITIKSDYRRQGNATFMLKAYLEAMKEELSIELILLLCKADLCGFYANCGFKMIGLSKVVHGQNHWFEMSFNLAHHRLLTQYQLDSFTSEGFKGNPAAVVIGMKSTEWMQNMGMENNLAETAFIQPVLTGTETIPSNIATYDLRWFTPAIEVQLCGHATLAAAYALFHYNHLNSSNHHHDLIDTIHFNTLYRGQLTARKFIENSEEFIEMNFPSQPPQFNTFIEEEIQLLCNGLKIQPNEIIEIGQSVDDAFVVVDFDVFLRIPTLSSGLLNFNDISRIKSRGVIVTCLGPNSAPSLPTNNTYKTEFYGKADFLSRFFAPRAGINEDPVTGSAHTTLAPYWCQKLNKNSLLGYQFSQRGGWVGVRQENDRIYLIGQCVGVKETKILIY